MRKSKLMMLVLGLLVVSPSFMANGGEANSNNVNIVNAPMRAEESEYNYRLENTLGEVSYSNSLQASIDAMSTGSTITILKDNLILGTPGESSTPIIVNLPSQKDLTIDLNGMTLTNKAATDFFRIQSRGITFTSSKEGAALISDNPDPASTVFRLLGDGATSSNDPHLSISGGIRIISSGDHAIYNDRMVLNINNAYVKSKSAAVVIALNDETSLQEPQLNVSHPDTLIYGISSGTSTAKGGSVSLNEGTILPTSQATNNYIYQMPNVDGATLRIYDVYVPRMYLANFTDYKSSTSVNKLDYDVVQATKTTIIDGVSYYLDRLIGKSDQVSYVSYGGVRQSTGKVPVPARDYHDDKNFYFPNDMIYKTAEEGFKWIGWYNSPSFAASAGPYGFRYPNRTGAATYHARFTFEVTFVSNVPEDDVNKAYDSSNKLFINSEPITHNAGDGVGNFTYAPLTRSGYEFLGWSQTADGSTEIFPADKLIVWDFNLVKNGQMTVYAIWGGTAEVAYNVEQYYEDINNPGTYTLEKTTTLYRRPFPGTGPYQGITNPGDMGNLMAETHILSMTPEHLSERRVPIKGDGTSVAKVYYTVKRYTVTFELNGGSFKSVAEGYDGSGGVYTVLHGKSLVAPSYIQAPYGYKFAGWSLGSNLTNIKSDLVNTPRWVPLDNIAYTFNYRASGFSSEIINQTFDSALKVPTTSTERPVTILSAGLMPITNFLPVILFQQIT